MCVCVYKIIYIYLTYIYIYSNILIFFHPKTAILRAFRETFAGPTASKTPTMQQPKRWGPLAFSLGGCRCVWKWLVYVSITIVIVYLLYVGYTIVGIYIYIAMAILWYFMKGKVKTNHCILRHPICRETYQNVKMVGKPPNNQNQSNIGAFTVAGIILPTS